MPKKRLVFRVEWSYVFKACILPYLSSKFWCGLFWNLQTWHFLFLHLPQHLQSSECHTRLHYINCEPTKVIVVSASFLSADPSVAPFCKTVVTASFPSVYWYSWHLPADPSVAPFVNQHPFQNYWYFLFKGSYELRVIIAGAAFSLSAGTIIAIFHCKGHMSRRPQHCHLICGSFVWLSKLV